MRLISLATPLYLIRRAACASLFLAFAPYPASADTAAALSLPQGAALVSVVPKGFVLDGDSITDGYGVTPTYPDHLAALSGAGVVNLGVSGRTLAEMAGRFDSRGVADLYDAGQHDTLVILGGINDILHDTDTKPETLQRLLLDYSRKARTAGFRVVVVTLLPVDNLPPAQEATRAAHNVWIRANWPDFADWLADAALEPRLSVPSDSRYYFDGLHLTADGLRVLAEVIHKATLPPEH